MSQEMRNSISAMADATGIFQQFSARMMKPYRTYEERIAEYLVSLASRDPNATEEMYRHCFSFYTASPENFKTVFKDAKKDLKAKGYVITVSKPIYKPAQAYTLFCKLVDAVVPKLSKDTSKEAYLDIIQYIF